MLLTSNGRRDQAMYRCNCWASIPSVYINQKAAFVVQNIEPLVAVLMIWSRAASATAQSAWCMTFSQRHVHS